ncbi:MAG TPA: phosphatidylglycerol lysyltransferase domain-containing protein, partial [Solirubrobacteraceae bacterium]|nr:phosphatidylglycerol lysyltransferase domain-containing protein [Solirubrobacteraceae bacterium]
AFAADGVLSYRVIRGTAVVSADPVAPGDGAGDVLAGFQDLARRRGWDIAVWGASERHLAAYRRLGLRAICVGEEAFVDPSQFSLEGRAVRKLRQSVQRVTRRGWTIVACDGRDVDTALEAEIEELAHRWRIDHPRLHGFAMGMGAYAAPMRPDDLYVLARSPEGRLGAVMRFTGYAGNLSLDTMQRVGDTPNGLNEALVVQALAVARERGIAEVSLNYAGLAHLVRREPSRRRMRRALTTLAMAPLHRRFQMDRLVRFNDKFSPQWRPRYLVYESRAALPRAILRVLQAEGYLPEPRPSLLLAALPRVLPAWARQRGALGEPR